MELTSKYETVFIVNPDFTEENAKGLLDKFTGLITENGGAVDKVDEWNKRRLAYPINYENEGYYVVIQHESEPSFVAEFTRKLNIADGVLRYLITSREEA